MYALIKYSGVKIFEYYKSISICGAFIFAIFKVSEKQYTWKTLHVYGDWNLPPPSPRNVILAKKLQLTNIILSILSWWPSNICHYNLYYNVSSNRQFATKQQQLTKIKSIALCKTAFIDDITVNTTSKCCTHPREPRRGQVTFGSHVTTTKKKARGKSRACAEPTSD
jgi:hypothetical protein